MNRMPIQERMRIVNKTRHISIYSILEMFINCLDNRYNCSIINTLSVLDVKDKSLYLHITAMKNSKIQNIKANITIN